MRTFLSRFASPTVFFLVAFTLIAHSLSLRFGLYNPTAYGLLVIAFIFVVIGSFLPSQEKFSPIPIIALCFMSLLALSAFSHPLLYPLWIKIEAITRAVNIIIFLCAAPLYLMPTFAEFPRVRQTAFFIFVGIAFVLRLIVPLVSPSPVIDVFAVQQESAQNFLQGLNPYATPIVSDVYHDHEKYGYPLPGGYWYLPGNLLLETISFALSGDVRFAHILGEGVFIYALWHFLRRKGDVLCELTILLFLFQPVGLFVIEQSWIEPLMLGTLGLSLLLLEKNYSRTANLFFGFFLGLKQILLFFPLHWTLVTRKISSFVLVAIGAGAAMIPFFLWNSSAFIENGVTFQLSTGFRLDSLSLSTFLYPMIGESGKNMTLTIAAISAVTCLFFFRRQGSRGFLVASTITTFAMFVFGHQAFCNYYYFVQGLLLLTFAHSTDA